MSDNQRIVIAGAGGFGKEVLQYLRDVGLGDRCAGFIDDAVTGTVVDDLVVTARIDDYSPELAGSVVVCVGDCNDRRGIAARLTDRGAELLTIVHPTAYVAPSATVGDGVIVAPFAFAGPHSVVGDNVVLNTYASVGHDTTIGAHSVLSPYAAVNGHATLGKGVFLATHTTVAVGVTVGKFSKASAGTVVMRDVGAGHLIAGNPARSREMFRIPD